MLKAMFVLTALIAVARLCVAQQQLVGAVVSKSGAPIPGVRVSSSRLVFAETNKKGEFSLRWFPGQKVVGFQKLGYMPLLKVIAEGQTQVPVEMERDDNSAWHPPECLEEREARIGGGPLRFLPPKDAKVDKRRDGLLGMGGDIQERIETLDGDLVGTVSLWRQPTRRSDYFVCRI